MTALPPAPTSNRLPRTLYGLATTGKLKQIKIAGRTFAVSSLLTHPDADPRRVIILEHLASDRLADARVSLDLGARQSTLRLYTRVRPILQSARADPQRAHLEIGCVNLPETISRSRSLFAEAGIKTFPCVARRPCQTTGHPNRTETAKRN